MAIQILGNNAPDGQSVGSSSTELAGLHGLASAQGSAITTMVTMPTTLTDGTIVVRLNTLVGKFNSLLTTMRLKGVIA